MSTPQPFAKSRVFKHSPLSSCEHFQSSMLLSVISLTLAFLYSYVNGERYPHVGQRSKEDFLRTVKLAWRGLIDEDNPDDDELKPQFEKPADGKSDPYEKVEL